MQSSSQLSIVAQLREARLPEKHALLMGPTSVHEDSEGPSPSKKPRLTILPQQPGHLPVKSMINHTTGGGIVTVSKAPVQSIHHHGGLLQIAKPIIHQSGSSGGIVQGIPVQQPTAADQASKIPNKTVQIEAKSIISTSFKVYFMLSSGVKLLKAE